MKNINRKNNLVFISIIPAMSAEKGAKIDAALAGSAKGIPNSGNSQNEKICRQMPF